MNDFIRAILKSLEEFLYSVDELIRWVSESGVFGATAVGLFAVAGACFFIWLFLVATRRRKFPLLAVGIIVAATGGFCLLHCARARLSNLRSFNLASVQLLPGYTMIHRWGDDTYTGSISRPGGLNITIDIGAMSGLWANPYEPKKHIWVFEQKVREHTVFIGLRTFGSNGDERMLCVTFPHKAVNFFATVRSERDIAEMLAIVLTYEPID